MAGEYASSTSVPVNKSREEIERTLSRFGATAFAYMTDVKGQVAISFEIEGLRVLMRMQLPPREDYMRDSRGKVRTTSAIDRDHEQACRQRWRSMANGIKAKLALIDDSISSVEREFLSDIVLPGGVTVGDRIVPEMKQRLASGTLPSLMPGTDRD